MSLRKILLITTLPIVFWAAAQVVHQYVGGLAPPPPVDRALSESDHRQTRTVDSAVASPTILQSRLPDEDLPPELRETLARRPDDPITVPTLPPDDELPDPHSASPLLLPVPEIKP